MQSNDRPKKKRSDETLSHAKELRKNMTPWERHLWYDFLRNYKVKFRRQAVFGSYVADFYCAQAKLVGDQIGLDPVVSLLAVYVGWQVWGVWGMLIFPLIFVLVQQLNDRGVVNLWKNA